MGEWLGPNRTADIVDQDVDASEVLVRLVHDPGTLGIFFEISEDCKALCPRLRNLIVRLVDQFGAIHEYGRTALLSEVHRDHAADALCRTGDDCDLSRKAIGMKHHESTAPIAVTTPLLANFS
jgi:hypothetical protein